MKTLNKKYKNKQSGFAMLEVMLAVIIIAIASLGIYRLYSSSSDSSRITSSNQIVSEIANAVSQYSVTAMQAPTNLDTLVQAGYLSQGVNVDTTDKTLLHTPVGDMRFDTTNTKSNIAAFQLVISGGITQSIAYGFFTDMCGLGDVSTTTGGSDPTTTSLCNDISGSAKSYKNGTAITITIPKGAAGQ